MSIYLNFFESVKSIADIVEIISKYVELKRKNREYLGICPFHNEKTPSFKVNSLRKFYHCFGCQAHGDVISFVSKITGLNYKESAFKIAQEYNIQIPVFSKEQKEQNDELEKIFYALEVANKFYKNNINSNLNLNIREYLKNRGIYNEDIEKYEIGYSVDGNHLRNILEKEEIPMSLAANSGLISKSEKGFIYEVFRNRIMIPIRNKYNKIVGFGGRITTDEMPKYINSPETSVFKKQNVFYGENMAFSSIYKSNFCIVVEGYFDCIALQKNGFSNTIATLGTAISENQIMNLWKICEEVVLCLDGDRAGIAATLKVIDMSLPYISANKQMSFISLENMDPDDYIKNVGSENFRKKSEQRFSMSEAIWHLKILGRHFEKAEDYAKLETNLRDLCKNINDQTLRYSYLRFFKKKLWDLHCANGKSNGKNDRIKLGSIVSNVKEINEIDIIENSIFKFIAKNFSMLDKENVDKMRNLDIKNPKLKELFFILDDSFNSINQEINFDKIKTLDCFKLLCKDIISEKENEINIKGSKENQNEHHNPEYLELLITKHSLFTLRKKYNNVIKITDLDPEFLKNLNTKNNYKALEDKFNEIIKKHYDSYTD
jgi:DNA primase